jgi:glycosyltransferase involved in cell wall biosynthesis
MTGVIVHEWIEEIGGSENVLDEIANVYPDAPIYCLWNDAPERFAPGRVRESWLAKTPLRRVKPLALLFMPFVWRRLKIEFQPDWILASTHLFAHHAKFVGIAPVRKLAYVHSPARYIWSPDLDSRGKSIFVRLVAPLLKSIDSKRAQELSSIAANSATVQARIEKYWDRKSIVIYPPVDVEFFKEGKPQLSSEEKNLLESLPETFVLGASRFVPYKRLDLALKFGEVTKTPVVLAGNGPDYEELLAWSKIYPEDNIHIVRSPSNQLLKALFSKAKTLVFGAVEDFGIMPVEAMAAGTPVIGPAAGGVSETVIDGKTGRLLSEFSNSEILHAEASLAGLSSSNCVGRADQFSTEQFRKKLMEWVTPS